MQSITTSYQPMNEYAVSVNLPDYGARLFDPSQPGPAGPAEPAEPVGPAEPVVPLLPLSGMTPPGSGATSPEQMKSPASDRSNEWEFL